MLIVRLMALYQQSNNKPDFLEQLQSFQALIVNREQKIYHKMLGENFEQQMEQLYAAFCNAFKSEEFAAVSFLRVLPTSQDVIWKFQFALFIVYHTGRIQDANGYIGNK